MPVYEDRDTGEQFAASTFDFFAEATLDDLQEYLQSNAESFEISSKVKQKLRNGTHNRNEGIWLLSYEDRTEAVTRDEYESRYW